MGILNIQFYPHLQPDSFPTVEQHFLFKSCAIKLPIPSPAAIFEWYQNLQKNGVAAETAYWSRLWPASMGICYYLDKHFTLIKNKKVLELGAGLGLPSLFVACHTNEVICSDIHPNAVMWAKNAAEKNGLCHIQHRVMDWNQIDEDLKQVDIVLISDGNYNPSNFDHLRQLIQGFLDRGTKIILCTPQRLAAKVFIASLLPQCTDQEQFDVQYEEKVTPVSVLYLNPQQSENV